MCILLDAINQDGIEEIAASHINQGRYFIPLTAFH
jgi:hypothetical protein